MSAEDNSNNLATGYNGTTTLSSSAGTDLAPTSVMLSGGTATFPVTLTAAGSQTITASAMGLSSGSAALTVGPGQFAGYNVGVDGPSTVTAGSSFLVTVQAADQYGNSIYNYTGPSTVTPNISPTSAGSNVPASVSISSFGLGIFQATMQKAGMYTLSVASGSYIGSFSPVTVTPAAAAKLGFTTEPVTTATGLVLPTVIVSVEDQFGNVVTSDNHSATGDSVTVGASGPGGFLEPAASPRHR